MNSNSSQRKVSLWRSGTVDADGLAEDAAEIARARIFQDLDHVVVRPDLGAVAARQVREAVQVVVMHVGRDGDVDALEAVPGAQGVDGVLDETDRSIGLHGIEKRLEEAPTAAAVIDEQRLAAVADDGVKGGGGLRVRDDMRGDELRFLLRW